MNLSLDRFGEAFQMGEMYTICLCDDDPTIRKELEKDITQYGIDRNIDIKTYSLGSTEELLAFDVHFDILFLDIRFNNKDVGIDAAEKLRASGNTALIVLITSYETMSIDGYRAEPFRFIVKPYTRETINRIIDLCFAKLQRTVYYTKVTGEDGAEIIRSSRIIYICSKNRKRYIVCDDRIIITWQSLVDLKAILPTDTFTYSHKSYIVNIEHISKILANNIVMDNGNRIPISAHYKDLMIRTISQNMKITLLGM
jgi:DNA-binding LytR/AlgR family response regulator